jgi:subtilisin-like proprotein convertase family protein
MSLPNKIMFSKFKIFIHSCVVLTLIPTAKLTMSAEITKAVKPIVIGQAVPVKKHIEYLAESSWEQVIHHPGASYIKVHVAALNLIGKDYITISNQEGSQSYTYPGDDFTQDDQPGFWALSIMGENAIIKLHSHHPPETIDRNKATQVKVVVDQYVYGFSPAEIAQKMTQSEIICGNDDRQDAICYENLLDEYNNSKPVVRLLINESWLCTGWRIGNGNYILTNEHCLNDQASVDSTEVWFNYQHTSCGGEIETIPTIVSGKKFLTTDYEKDVSLFTVNNFDSIKQFGYLELDIRAPILDEEIYIPQHGAGNPKQLAIFSDSNAGNICRINSPVAAGNNGALIDTGYLCDTEGGSSGSPVLARSSHKVIALHHWGGCENQGIRIDQIWPIVEPYLTATIEFADANYQAVENQTIVNIPVMINQGTGAGNVSVTYSITGGTATYNVDYVAPMTGILEWLEGDIDPKNISITLLDDDKLEGNETITLLLSEPNGINLGDQNQAVLTITDDEACSMPGMAIPDNDPNGVQDSFSLNLPNPLNNLDVSLDLSHTWVGDLTISLEQVETATKVDLLRKSNCSGDNIDVIFDDDAQLSIQDNCINVGIAYPDIYYRPAQPLSNFNTNNASGTWKLTVIDEAGGDTGILNSWCLQPNLEQVEITSLVSSASTCPGETVDVTFQMNIPQDISLSQVYLQFDPAKLQVNTITNSGMLPMSLQEEFDNIAGYIKFTAGIFDPLLSPLPLGAFFDLFTVNFSVLEETPASILQFNFADTFTVSNEGEILPQISNNASLTLMCPQPYQVNLQGRVSPPHISWQTDLNLNILGFGHYTSTTDAQGIGELPILPSNNYTGCIKNTHTLQRQVDFTIPTDIVDFGVLLEGDADDDNDIDWMDYFILFTSKNKCQNDLGYEANADFNVDNCITKDDALLLASNYGKVGDSCGERTRSKTRQYFEQSSPEAIQFSIPDTVPVGVPFEVLVKVAANPQQPVSAITTHLYFDPQHVQINALTATDTLDLTLQKNFDNNVGEIYFVATLWDNLPVTTPFTLFKLNLTVLTPEAKDQPLLSFHKLTATENKVSDLDVTSVSCQLYGVQSEGEYSQFFTIRPQDYTVKLLGKPFQGYRVKAITVNPQTNILYALAEENVNNATKGSLYTVDAQTGKLSMAEPATFLDISQFAFGMANELWGWQDNYGLIQLNPQTGNILGQIPTYSPESLVDLTLNYQQPPILFGIAEGNVLKFDISKNWLDFVCPNIFKEPKMLQIITEELLLIGNFENNSFNLHLLDLKTCQDRLNLSLPELGHVIDIALPIEACNY